MRAGYDPLATYTRKKPTQYLDAPVQSLIPGVIPPEEFLARVRTITPGVGSGSAPGRRLRLQEWQKAGKSPTQRTLAYMRDQGYVCDVVERSMGPRRKRDCFGAFDIVCVPPKEGERVVFVQTTGTTGGGNFRARVRKVTECEHLPAILRACRVIVHGWAKRKAGWVLKELEL